MNGTRRHMSLARSMMKRTPLWFVLDGLVAMILALDLLLFQMVHRASISASEPVVAPLVAMILIGGAHVVVLIVGFLVARSLVDVCHDGALRPITRATLIVNAVMICGASIWLLFGYLTTVYERMEEEIAAGSLGEAYRGVADVDATVVEGVSQEISGKGRIQTVKGLVAATGDGRLRVKTVLVGDGQPVLDNAPYVVRTETAPSSWGGVIEGSPEQPILSGTVIVPDAGQAPTLVEAILEMPTAFPKQVAGAVRMFRSEEAVMDTEPLRVLIVPQSEAHRARSFTKLIAAHRSWRMIIGLVFLFFPALLAYAYYDGGSRRTTA